MNVYRSTFLYLTLTLNIYVFYGIIRIPLAHVYRCDR